jgi:tripartite ATP-independent transporter DctM subunit
LRRLVSDSAPGPSSVSAPPKSRLERLDHHLTRLETVLCVLCATWLVGSLTLWVALKGLASLTTTENAAGVVFRAIFGAGWLAGLGWLATRKLDRPKRRLITVALTLAGVLTAPLWKNGGTAWGANLLNWLQDGSTLTLLGGLRGLGTRLTLALALLGGALATAAGRHVTIDLLSRSLPQRLRKPAMLIGGLAAAAVCFTSAWGFFDFIGVDTFGGPVDATVSQRLGELVTGARRHFFFFRRQAVLDLRVAPKVLAGEKWDEAVSGEEWNAWLDAAAWSDWFEPEVVQSLREEPSAHRAPLIVTPKEPPRGLLARSLSLIVPFGLLWIAVRFLLWALRGGPTESEHGAPHEPKRPWVPVAVLTAIPSIAFALLGPVVAVVALGAFIGAPLFAVMGGAAELAWLASGSPLRHMAPKVLDEQFAGSPVLVTIPLFTLLGYLLAESKAPERIVGAARAFLGWMPGGLALVCLVASAFFTTLTGGSGVTIVAIGGLLVPTLLGQRYPERFSMGLVTTGGSLGLLFPPSLAILVYALVAGLDFTLAFKAGLLPGLLVLGILIIYSVVIGVREKVAREPLKLSALGSAVWTLKWELGVPVLILSTMGSGLAGLDESAGVAVAYAAFYELGVHRDLEVKRDLGRLLHKSMALAGAVILILLMANALMNWVIDRQVPMHVLEALTSLGLTERWQFLVALNVFLLVVGMVMDGFSAILVAVPLVLPFAARFGLHPFHLAMMFILNLELAFCMPPLGLNLFIAAFRFQRPLSSLYRSALPFVGLLAVSLGVVMAFPWLSSVLVQGDIDAARARAEKLGEAPREAWIMECVQADSLSPQPCSEADRARYARDAGNGEDEDSSLFEQMMGGGGAGPSDAGAE